MGKSTKQTNKKQINGDCIALLKEWKKSSRGKYNPYAKALRELQKHKTEISLDRITSVRGIGPKIAAWLMKELSYVPLRESPPKQLSPPSPAPPPPEMFHQWDASITNESELPYEIILIVDSCEKDFPIGQLHGHNIRVEIRQIALGDMVFIAKSADGCEFILDIVIERKTINDLDISIIDGRYKEQKYRLHKSEISTIVYIVEGPALKTERLKTVVMTLQIFDHFHVQ
ncbi:restriction endonuclease type II-like protein [Jimgerdemannia flammicorona]|uniref:Crossover junction endonuclease MUS81 n=1 Tax=Jimgerdemannia flammicorona TaxID=994334 RepID=A0A433DAM2_9FUNG|nr:restriction endonuclease type II-like protein [Jimgerdemannia flammicorona]